MIENMELHFSEITTAPTPAATVILLRAGQGGLEVLLQKRHSKMDVLAGAYVFPGGKVDPEDYDEALQAHLDQTPAQLAAQLAQADISPALAAALHVAALRELLEESTILLDHESHLQHIDTLLAQLKSGNSFAEAITSLGLPLTTATLKPWSRWITPKRAAVTSKRFDTLFFVGMLPDGQTAAHDHLEATDSLWLNPRQALLQYWAGEVELAPPQIMTLAHLSRFSSPDAAMRHAASRPPFAIEPEPHDLDGTRWLHYPGDALHSVPTQHMPGPTRLAWRNKRFEPLDGFEAFFA
jgi:8-oxo-dGTP pyrophosphatase MutT (NUDIX family)